ncbi:uncharacterized protein LOC143197347 [Rhynchophorus ferrugineus]|uniref:uncharacterized protein LOC143197347 n=1 Tax=Rhynchophorus ferrugineus TaxID=354439 RepID=UPI003FCD7FFC
MERNHMNPNHVDTISIARLDNLLRTVFSEEEWTNMSAMTILHHRNVLVAYLTRPGFRETYTLSEFLRIERDHLMIYPPGETPSESSSASTATNYIVGNSTPTSSSSDEDVTNINGNVQEEEDEENEAMDLSMMHSDRDIEIDSSMLAHGAERQPPRVSRKRQRAEAMASYRVPRISRRSSYDIIPQASTNDQEAAGPSSETSTLTEPDQAGNEEEDLSAPATKRARQE